MDRTRKRRPTFIAGLTAAILLLGATLDFTPLGGSTSPIPAAIAQLVALPTPTRPSSVPPSPTRTPRLEPTDTPLPLRAQPTDEPTATPKVTPTDDGPARNESATPTRVTSTATRPAVATSPPQGPGFQADIFSPTPTLPVFGAEATPTPTRTPLGLGAPPTSTNTPNPAAPVPFATASIPQAPTGDLRPMRIEVFQSVHESHFPGGPEVPLIADKDSLVRVWVILLGSEPAGNPWQVRVSLRAFRNGQELGGCAQATADVEKTIYEDVTLQNYENVMSGTLARTFNFHLPPNCHWTDAGVTELRAHVSGPECTACLDNNTIEGPFRFHQVRPLRLRFHLLNYQGQPTPFSYAGLVPLLSAWPISNIQIQPFGPEIQVPDTIDLSGDPADGFDGSFWTNYGDLLSYLQGCCGSDDVDLEIGVLPQSLVTCAGYGGGGWFVSGIGCGGTYAHEAGHAFGLDHSSNVHGECDGGTCDANWPFPHGGIDAYGWSFLRPDKLILPQVPAGHSHDTMSYGSCADAAPGYDDDYTSYCGNWMSSLTYGRIGQRLSCFDPQWDVEEDILFGVSLSDLLCYTQPWPLGGPFAALLMNPLNDLLGNWTSPGLVHAASLQSPPPGRAAEVLRLSGAVNPSGAVELRPAYHMASERTAPPSDASGPPRAGGAFRVELRDADGALLVGGSFEPTPLYAHVPIRRSSFQVRLPWDPAAARLLLRRGNEIVVDRQVSPTPPSVRLLGPLGGEQYGAAGSLPVSWEAVDPDDDPLTYWLQYSPDAGQTWTTIFRDLSQTHYTLDLDRLPASSTARIRVLASDGVRTAVAESGIFAGRAGRP